MAVNGVEFDELEKNVVMVRVSQEREDKPLTTELLQLMMDQGTIHGRALISFLVSTGCRAGETSNLLLSDVGRIENGRFVPDITGEVVQVRNEIAKGRKGGLVFLTSEAREYLTVWLKDRARYIADADERTKKLFTLKGGKKHERTPRKDIGIPAKRPANDQRLFACSYATLDKTFNRMYKAADGERGITGNKITAHGCRAYFRTHAVKGMSIDLAEGILRHTGYLNAEYFRMAPEERYKQFREGEASLYLTRADHRIQTGKLSELERHNQQLQAQVAELQRMQELKVKIEDTPEFKAEIQKYKDWKASQK
jgi:integrase